MRHLTRSRSGFATLLATLIVTASLHASTPVANLTCNYDTVTTAVMLNWMNTEAYSTIRIERDGVLLTVLSGGDTSFVDTPPMLPAVYSVTPTCQGVPSTAESCEAMAGPTSPNSVWFSGYLHTAEGEAILEPTPEGKLKVDNLGSSGCDGVSVDMGGSDRLDIEFEDLDPAILPPGTTVSFEGRGVGPMGPSPSGAVRFVVNDNHEFLVSADDAVVAGQTYTVRVHLNGQVVHTEPGLAGDDPFAMYPDPDDFYYLYDLNGNITASCLTKKIVGPCLVGPDVDTGGGSVVVGDSISITPDTPNFVRPTQLDILVSTATPLELTIVRTSTHFDGHPVVGTGDVHLETETGASAGKLKVSNLGSSGCDGVSISDPDDDPEFESIELEADLLADDTGNHEGWIELLSVGHGVMRATEENDQWSFSADYSEGGSPTYTMEIWDQGTLVHSESGLSGTGAVSAFKIRLFYREYENGQLVEKCFISFEPATITTTGGVTVTGDVIMTRPDSPMTTVPSNSVLRGANLADFYVIDLESQVAPAGPEFRRGDCNADGAKNIGDAITLLDLLFSGGGPVACDDACDANDDGGVNLGDAITVLNYLFVGGSIPAPEDCGIDPSDDSVGCDTYPCP